MAACAPPRSGGHETPPPHSPLALSVPRLAVFAQTCPNAPDHSAAAYQRLTTSSKAAPSERGRAVYASLWRLGCAGRTAAQKMLKDSNGAAPTSILQGCLVFST